MVWVKIRSGLRRSWDQSCGQDAVIWQLEQTMWCECIRDLNRQERLKPGTFPRHTLLLESSIDEAAKRAWPLKLDCRLGSLSHKITADIGQIIRVPESPSSPRLRITVLLY